MLRASILNIRLWGTRKVGGDVQIFISTIKFVWNSVNVNAHLPAFQLSPQRISHFPFSFLPPCSNIKAHGSIFCSKQQRKICRDESLNGYWAIESILLWFRKRGSTSRITSECRNFVRAPLRHANHLEREFRLSICEVIEFHSETIFTWNYNWKLLP